MGTTLTGTTPQDTYDSLIKVTDNDMLFGDSSCVSCGACAHTCPTDAISDIFKSKKKKVKKTGTTVTTSFSKF